jgi:dTDP-4-dehydrorhamnose 3,5-epimerase
MTIQELSLSGVLLIEPRVFADERGHFMETWHQQKFAAAGLDVAFVQDNHSQSRRGVLRGLHYQLRRPQGKLVRVVRGEVFDVAVDLRRSSPTFGHWVGEALSEANHRQMYIPAGFAHGFCVLSDRADVVYKCTDFYDRDDEHTLLWNDPTVAIDWPITEPILSPKDLVGRSLDLAAVFD